ncbi:hypothetical protein CHU94_14475 [Rhodoferax sp. TH121]|uniref:hypothetical protein n=1 Tax=Rhodoferax sp. TH121 TaxID=2022803 RepID=UPI000B95DF37|nr:hypothetical protein [Rhodoferax sp. TH121]OYQ38654.1 hypothetical protein CHU94_14475 [Rhodoferax sp. TH121]
MDIDAKILGVLGTALSALFAAWTYFAKIRYEHRRATRVVLYHVLEMHHHIARWNEGVTDFPKNYLRKCNEVLKKRGLVLSEENHKALEAALSNLIRNTAVTEIEQTALIIGPPFLKALEDLAKENPLLAFQLKGKEGLDKPSKFVRDYMERELNDGSEESIQGRKFLSIEADDFIHAIAVRELRRSVLLVAWHCGVWTYWKCRAQLSRQGNREAFTELDTDISDFLETYFQSIQGPRATSP